MYKNFDEVVTVMSAASAAKLHACLGSLKWDAKGISKALSDTDLNVDVVCTIRDGQNLEAVQFNCTVGFEANEIPGIVAPFYCCLYVEAAYDKEIDNYSCRIGYGPRGMLSADDYSKVYDVCFLYNEFCKKKPKLDIHKFVSNDFDFPKICKSLNVGKITTNSGKTLFEDNT